MTKSQSLQTLENTKPSTSEHQQLLREIAELNTSAQKIRSRYPEKARKLYKKALALSGNNDLFLTEKAASLAGMAFLSN